MTSSGQHLQIRAGALQFCCHRSSDAAGANHQSQASPSGRSFFDHVNLLRRGDRLAEIRHHRLVALTAVLVPIRCHFWLPAAIGSLFMAALIGWLARPLSQRPDQLRSSLADLLDHDSTVGSSVVPKVPPGADHVPLEIRVGLVSQSPITAFRPGPNVLCRYQHGDVIPAQELMKRIASSPQHEFCLLYTSPSPRDGLLSRMPSSA